MPVSADPTMNVPAVPVAAPGLRAGLARRLRQAMPWAALCASLALPWLAAQFWGPDSLALAAAAAALLAWAAGRWHQGPQTHTRPLSAATAGQTGADGAPAEAPSATGMSPATDAARLAVQVVPVWERDVAAARSHSERSSAQLLESFAGVSGHLDQALNDANGQLQLDADAPDQLLARHEAEVQRLSDLGRQAVGLQRRMREALQSCTAELAEMALLTKEVQQIGRTTHLLALNTSVEASRSNGQGSGFMVVAQEVRQLAGQSREAGSRLARLVSAMQERLAELERDNRRAHLDDDDEIDLRTEQAARAVVLALLESLSQVTRSSRQLRAAGAEVQADLEKIFVALQSQDRFSQMLESVMNDMVRYSAWLNGASDPEAGSPAQWLARLEASYTMEELRSSHHGTTAVEQRSSVEFF